MLFAVCTSLALYQGRKGLLHNSVVDLLEDRDQEKHSPGCGGGPLCATAWYMQRLFAAAAAGRRLRLQHLLQLAEDAALGHGR